MGCKCGAGGGPIIVRPEINLDEEITVEAVDHELQVLCDADGVAFLRRYTVDAGQVTTVDTTFDGTTAFTPTDPVGTCQPQDDQSPGQECLHCQTLRLFDDGNPFLRTVCRDCTGQVVSTTDTTVDGGDYTVVGEVTTCCPDESPGPQVEHHPVLLCDDGTPFVRTYTLTDGVITAVADTDLSGAPYAAGGTIGVCPTGGDQSPGAECGDTEVLVLCDDDGAGTVTRFMRRLTYDCDGVLASTEDTELDGATAYTPVGTVGVCPSEATHVELVEVCDDTDGDGRPDVRFARLYRVDPSGDQDPAAIGTYTLDLSAPYTPVAEMPCTECPPPPDPVPPAGEPTATDTDICAPPNSGIVPLPGGGQPLFDGGSLTVPSDPDGSAGNGFRVNRAVAASLQADRPECDDGTATVTVSVRVCNDGPNPTPSDYAGSLCIFAPDCSGELLPHAVIAAPMQPGECQTLSTTVNVTAAQLAAGDVIAVLDTNTYSEHGPKSWTWDSWQTEYTYGTEGCADPDTGTGCCEEQVQKVELCEPVVVKQTGDEAPCASVTVQDLCDDVNGDGSELVRYQQLLCVSPSGTVRVMHTYRGTPSNLYSPNNPVPCPASGDCGTTQVISLCDRVDGSDEPEIVRFLRHLTFGCDGTLIATVDTTPAGDPYTVQGEIGSCDPDPTTCGLSDDDITSGSAPGGTFIVTDSAVRKRNWPLIDSQQVPGGGQPLWDGGSVTFGPDTGPPPEPLQERRRWVSAILQADRPPCDDGTVQVSASVRVTNNGPETGYVSVGEFSLWNADQFLGRQTPTKNPPVGHQETLTLSATVPATDLAAGRIAVWLALETWDARAEVPPGEKSWTADQFQATYAYGTGACPPEAPVSNVRICGPVTIGGGMLSGSGGDGGDGGAGAAGRQVLERKRCDDTDGDGLPDTEFVELWRVEGDAPQLIGTFSATNLAEEYEPVSPVSCDTTVVCETEDGQSGLAQLVKPCEPLLTIGTGGTSSTGGTPFSGAINALVPGRLLSLTVTNVSGSPIEVSSAGGTVLIPAGHSLTWSVQDNRTEELGEILAEIQADTHYILHWTYAD